MLMFKSTCTVICLTVPLPQFPEISLRFFLPPSMFDPPSIGHVNLRIIGISPRSDPPISSASLAIPPSFTFLSLLLLLILARRDFGLFCGIGANSSSPLPATAVSSSAALISGGGDRGLGASVTRRERAPSLPRIDGWMDRCFGQLAMFSPFFSSSSFFPIVSRCQMSIDDAAVAVGAAAGDPCGPAAGARGGRLPRRR